KCGTVLTAPASSAGIVPVPSAAPAASPDAPVSREALTETPAGTLLPPPLPRTPPRWEDLRDPWQHQRRPREAKPTSASSGVLLSVLIAGGVGVLVLLAGAVFWLAASAERAPIQVAVAPPVKEPFHAKDDRIDDVVAKDDRKVQIFAKDHDQPK